MHNKVSTILATSTINQYKCRLQARARGCCPPTPWPSLPQGWMVRGSVWTWPPQLWLQARLRSGLILDIILILIIIVICVTFLLNLSLLLLLDCC